MQVFRCTLFYLKNSHKKLFDVDCTRVWFTLLPVETAYKTYLKFYEKSKRKKIEYIENELRAQEQALHIFLRFYSKKIHNNTIAVSSRFASELNIETALAHIYEKELNYYQFSTEYKSLSEN